MGLARRSGAPVRIRLRASFYTALFATVALLAACLWLELRPAAGSSSAPGRQLSFYPPDAVLTEPYFEDPNKWLVILHCIGIGYMLLGLNTVCDVYFTGALEVMVDKWGIKPDVAGATFMAAGGSAPEFFASLIGTTMVFTDVGFSTIVGSAVFNVLFVIGLCGFVANGDIELTWWPLFRDCSFYICGLSLLAFCASDERIGLSEGIGLFVFYLVYCSIMYFNPRIEAMVDSKVRKAKKQVVPSEADCPARKVMPLTESESSICRVAEEDEGASIADQSAGNSKVDQGRSPSTYGKVDEDQPLGHRNSVETAATSMGGMDALGTGVVLAGRPSMATTIGTSTAYHRGSIDTDVNTSNVSVAGHRGSIDTDLMNPPSAAGTAGHRGSIDTEVMTSPSGGGMTAPPKPSEVLSSIGDSGGAGEVVVAEEQEPPKEGEEEGSKASSEDLSFIERPEGRFNQIVWFASLPVYVPVYCFIPRPRADRHMFVVCFLVSLIWIAGFSFLLVWWTNTLAQVLGVPDVIKDFTLLAMGTSIPDAASSVAVARIGEGDMAVSSSIGSNVFDILVGLPVPWVIKILIEGGRFDYQVVILSPYLVFYVILLLGMVISVILSIHFLGWKLNKALGLAMALLYIIFLAIALSVEILRPPGLMI